MEINVDKEMLFLTKVARIIGEDGDNIDFLTCITENHVISNMDSDALSIDDIKTFKDLMVTLFDEAIDNILNDIDEEEVNE